MFAWTEQNVETLRSMWGQHSAAEIAKRLGAVSRNAVIGKAGRIGLARLERDATTPRLTAVARTAPPKKPAVVKKSAAKKISPPPMPKEDLPPPIIPSVARPDPLNMRLIELASPERRGGTDCRYIVSEQGERALFCGHNTAEGSPYCTYHARVCYQPRENRKKVKI